MNCEVRKSCSLKNVVYEIGKLSAPVGVILVDTLDGKSDALFKTPRDKFWEQLVTVFIDVKQAYEYTLEEDIRLHINGPSLTGPIVLELDPDHALTKGRAKMLVSRLRALGVKRVAMVCIVDTNPSSSEYAEKLVSMLDYTNPKSPGVGIDLMIILDNDITDSDF